MEVAEESWVAVEYGSSARGDADDVSDYDVLILGSTQFARNSVAVPRGASISFYTWSEFSKMSDYGSLFLHHIRSEAKVLNGSRAGKRQLDCILSALPRYQRAEKDVDAFRLAVADVQSSLNEGNCSYAFELSSLATVMRHASIVGCDLLGETCFGRYQSVRTFVALTALSDAIALDYPALYEFKLAASSRVDEVPVASRELVQQWIHRTAQLVGEVGIRACSPCTTS